MGPSSSCGLLEYALDVPSQPFLAWAVDGFSAESSALAMSVENLRYFQDGGFNEELDSITELLAMQPGG